MILSNVFLWFTGNWFNFPTSNLSLVVDQWSTNFTSDVLILSLNKLHFANGHFWGEGKVPQSPESFVDFQFSHHNETKFWILLKTHVSSEENLEWVFLMLVLSRLSRYISPPGHSRRNESSRIEPWRAGGGGHDKWGLTPKKGSLIPTSAKIDLLWCNFFQLSTMLNFVFFGICICRQVEQNLSHSGCCEWAHLLSRLLSPGIQTFISIKLILLLESPSSLRHKKNTGSSDWKPLPEAARQIYVYWQLLPPMF